MRFLPLPQVIGEVLLDVLHKVVRVLRVEVQYLVQALQVDALQVTVGQRLDVGIGLYHSVVQRHVGPDQVALPCSERETAQSSRCQATRDSGAHVHTGHITGGFCIF